MSNRQRQRGLSIVGFIFVTAVVVIAVMIGFRMVPAYIEWMTVQRTASLFTNFAVTSI